MVSATIFKASGLPAYVWMRRARSSAVPHELLVCEQLLAGLWLQPSEVQRAHRGVHALQRHQVGRFLPAGQEQATLVRRFAHPAQHVPIPLVTGTIVPSTLPFLK